MVSPGTITAGECRLRVCPCSEHICQLRLDFSTFVLNQPDTSTTTGVMTIGGIKSVEKTQCQTDIFSVTTPGNNAPPQICGTNSGEHSNEYLLTKCCIWKMGGDQSNFLPHFKTYLSTF